MELLVPFYAVVLAVTAGRYVGAAGRRRFETRSDTRAREIHAYLTSGFRWLIPVYLAIVGVVQLVAAIDARSPVRVLLATITLVGLACTLLFARLALPGISAAYAERDLPPAEQVSAFVARDRSARRSRRQGQLARVALGAFMAAVGLSVLDGLTDAGWVTVPLVIAWAAVVIALVAWGWSMAWLYGDEQPPDPVVDEPHQTAATHPRAT